MKTPINLKTFAFIFLALAFVGFLDTTYLTAQHYQGTIPPCLVTEGCATVLTSKWNNIFGLPVALLGAIYYLTLLLLTAVYLKSKNLKFMLVAAFATAIGLFASLWFVILQIFIIREICLYCMISATTSTALFVIGLLILIKSKSNYMVNELAE